MDELTCHLQDEYGKCSKWSEYLAKIENEFREAAGNVGEISFEYKVFVKDETLSYDLDIIKSKVAAMINEKHVACWDGKVAIHLVERNHSELFELKKTLDSMRKNGSEYACQLHCLQGLNECDIYRKTEV